MRLPNLSGIYQIECIDTNKIYIGSASNLRTRINKHKSQLNRNEHDNSYLQRAWNKYGHQRFDVQVLELCSEDMLLEREAFYIQNLSCLAPIGFNIVADPVRFSVSDETKRKISDSSRGKKKTLEHNQKVSEALIGRKFSDEHRQNIRKALVGRKLSQEHKESISRGLARGC